MTILEGYTSVGCVVWAVRQNGDSNVDSYELACITWGMSFCTESVGFDDIVRSFI